MFIETGGMLTEALPARAYHLEVIRLAATKGPSARGKKVRRREGRFNFAPGSRTTDVMVAVYEGYGGSRTTEVICR